MLVRTYQLLEAEVSEVLGTGLKVKKDITEETPHLTTKPRKGVEVEVGE